MGADFWTTYQPGFRFTTETVGTPEFFHAVEEHRYKLEPHIIEMARFDDWNGKDVLDVGCGIATDGIRFARAGARYTGVDPSPAALDLARKRFAHEERDATFVQASATELPFPDDTFDLVWSHGVIHHVDDTAAAVREFHRVLRPGGHAIVMVYHRPSFNYTFTIMFVRRLLAAMLISDRGAQLARKITGEDAEVIDGHRRLLQEHGRHYLTDRQLFLSNNTDGPGNPLSKAYTARQLLILLREAGFTSAEAKKRYLNLRIYPGGERLARSRPARMVEPVAGWHLYGLGLK